MPARNQCVLVLAAAATSPALLLAALAGHMELLAYAAPLFVVELDARVSKFDAYRAEVKGANKMTNQGEP